MSREQCRNKAECPDSSLWLSMVDMSEQHESLFKHRRQREAVSASLLLLCGGICLIDPCQRGPLINKEPLIYSPQSLRGA